MLLEEIRLKANETYIKVLINSNNDNNSDNLLILQKIINILKDNNCFLKIKIDLALNILVEIGYSKEEAKDIYVRLINESKKNIQGGYKFIEI